MKAHLPLEIQQPPKTVKAREARKSALRFALFL